MAHDQDMEKFQKKVQQVRNSRAYGNINALYRLDTKEVLDIGCSEGHYLATFGKGSVGVTIIDEHVELGRKNGLTIISSNVEDPNFSMEKTFDVVWANNIFEHLHSPHLFLRKMAECLKPEGVLILGVTVIPYLSFLTRFKKFRGAFTSSHVSYYNRRILIETVKAAGFDVLEARLFFRQNPFIDWCMNLIAPHIYVVARPRADFQYSHKRKLSLKGYEGYNEESGHFDSH